MTNAWLSELSSYPLLRNETRKTQLRAAGREVFDFGLGDPLEETPAFIREALLAAVPKVSQYPSSQGSPAFREACAAWAKRRFGVELDPVAGVLSSNGSKEAIFHAPQVLLNATSNRRVVVSPDPGFPVYRSSTLLAGGVGYEVPLRPERGYVFDPADVPAPLLPRVAACWVSYPHNPTGALLPRADAERIYAWALANDVVLLSDECYVDMYFPGTEAPVSFLEVSRSQGYRNVLAFFSLSKRSGMTGYRSGFVAGDPRLVSAFGKIRPHVGLGTPTFVQAAAIAAWNDDEHSILRNEVFARKRSLVDAFLSRHGFTVVPSTATFYVWVKAPAGWPSGEAYVAALAEATGIVATPGDALGDSCAEFFRLALVPTPEDITRCLKSWDTWIASRPLPSSANFTPALPTEPQA
jgi:LL-diaminopimelate aminotransferase